MLKNLASHKNAPLILLAGGALLLALFAVTTQNYLLILIAIATVASLLTRRWWVATIYLYIFAALSLSLAAAGILASMWFFAAGILAIQTLGVFILRARLEPPRAVASRWLQWSLLTLALLLVGFSLTALFSPHTAGWNATSVTCGSAVVPRDFSASHWPNFDAKSLQNQCSDYRNLPLGLAGYLGSLAVLAIIGLVDVSRYRRSRRSPLVFGVVVLITVVFAVGGSLAWTSATVRNADRHNRAFQPWVSALQPTFEQMDNTNSRLNTAMRESNTAEAIAACEALQAVAQSLQGSEETWPARYSREKTLWKDFLQAYERDTAQCKVLAAEDPTRARGAFRASNEALNAVRPTLAYH